MYKHNDPDYKHLRRKARSNATKQEKRLWEYLRNRKLAGYKFRRNAQIGRYYVDFYCAEKNLVLEIDGLIHEHLYQKEYDQDRDHYLNSEGFTVVRIKNQEIDSDIDNVLMNIRNILSES